MMPTINDAPVVLGVSELRGLGERFGVQTWPVVLDPTLRSDRADDAVEPATVASELIDHDEPVPWLATVLRVLSKPDREIEMRSFAQNGIRRVCLARRGYEHVLAERNGDRVALTVLESADLDTVAGTIRARFEDVPACEFTAFSAPTDELVDRLGECRTSTEITDALFTLGAPFADAAVAGAALASCRVRTEIVATSDEDGRFAQSSGAVAVFDTARGRVVSSPSKSPDGRVWTTLSPGSGHRITQAVRLLVETLPTGTWST
ncbi:ESX secretion-associated protein EspG [Gordonia aurantiaca]|uniref:ESX secretion-associated protein EspG n=1 Tax=Gordonia sp. B21 TaxID=3151852 RepID=UPI0032632D4C